MKAIKGGVIAIKGQLIKGSGYLISAKGKLISSKGEAITKLGKNIATSAVLSPTHGHSEGIISSGFNLKLRATVRLLSPVTQHCGGGIQLVIMYLVQRSDLHKPPGTTKRNREEIGILL